MPTVTVILPVVDHLSEAALECVTEVVDDDNGKVAEDVVCTILGAVDVTSGTSKELIEIRFETWDVLSEIKLGELEDIKGVNVETDCKAIEVVGKILDTMGVTVENCKELMDTVSEVCEVFTEVTIALRELGEALGVVSEVEIARGILEVSGEDLNAVDGVWRAVIIVLEGDQFKFMGEVVGITDVA